MYLADAAVCRYDEKRMQHLGPRYAPKSAGAARWPAHPFPRSLASRARALGEGVPAALRWMSRSYVLVSQEPQGASHLRRARLPRYGAARLRRHVMYPFFGIIYSYHFCYFIMHQCGHLEHWCRYRDSHRQFRHAAIAIITMSITITCIITINIIPAPSPPPSPSH